MERRVILDIEKKMKLRNNLNMKNDVCLAAAFILIYIFLKVNDHIIV